jgi:hypothetical protein
VIAKEVVMRSRNKSGMSNLVQYLTDEEQGREGPEALADYMTDDQGNDFRVGQVTITNCLATEHEWAALEMTATQKMNTRAKSDKTYHLIISFREGEKPEVETLQKIETQLVGALGYANHQRLSVVHHDTDNLHVHVAINKIHPVNYTLHEPYYDYRILAKECAAIELEFGLEHDNHEPNRRVAEAKAADMTAHTGAISLITWIKEHAADELEKAESWVAFSNVLAENSLQLKQRANGFVFLADEGTRCKASSVSRTLSKPALEKRLGPLPERLAELAVAPDQKQVEKDLTELAGEIRIAYSLSDSAESFVSNLEERDFSIALVTAADAKQSAKDADVARTEGKFKPVLKEGEIVAITPQGFVYPLTEALTGDKNAEIQKYLSTLDKSKLPTFAEHQRDAVRGYQRFLADKAGLYPRYQKEQSENQAKKIEALKQARFVRDLRIAGAKRSAALERATAKLLKSGRFAYGLISSGLVSEIKRAKKDFDKERKIILTQAAPRLSWMAWLKTQHNDKAAEAALRTLSKKQSQQEAIKGKTPSREVASQQAAKTQSQERGKSAGRGG